MEVLATLAELPLAASNHLVTPVLGWWSPSRVAAVDHTETVEVFRVPVGRPFDPKVRFTSTLHQLGRTFRGPAFDLDGTIVWGFTAMVLGALFEAVGWTLAWERVRKRPIGP